MSEFLKLEDLIDFSDNGYEEAIVEFLKDNDITVDDFEDIGKCDSECPQCGAESFSIWRRDIGFIRDKAMFTINFVSADDVLDFSIYWCNKCGKWTTYIE